MYPDIEISKEERTQFSRLKYVNACLFWPNNKFQVNRDIVFPHKWLTILAVVQRKIFLDVKGSTCRCNNILKFGMKSIPKMQV